MKLYQVWLIDHTWDGGETLKGTYTTKAKAQAKAKSIKTDGYCYTRITELNVSN